MPLALVRRSFVAIILIVLAVLPGWAQQRQPVPPLSAHVTDLTATLTAADLAALEARLVAFEQQKGSQIAVLMVGTTQPEDIAAYALRVAREWKIGRRDVGDGVLVIVAKNDRRMRIEVARALEGAVPDLAASRIIDQQMAPRFRQNDYAGGLGAALDQLMARISGEALPEPQPANARAGAANAGPDWLSLGVFLFFAVMVGGPILRALFGKTLGSAATGLAAGGAAFLLTASVVVGVLAGIVALFITLLGSVAPLANRRRGGPIVLPGGGGWGGGGGFGGGGFGGGGGGWSSGGGGSFGGGGASGGW